MEGERSRRLCEICGESLKEAVCRLCGREVCKSHLARNNMCSVCYDSICRSCSSRLSVGRCVSCGWLVCVECSVQVDPVRRLCRRCSRGAAARVRRPREALALATKKVLGESL